MCSNRLGFNADRSNIINRTAKHINLIFFMTDAPLGIARTRNVTCPEELDHPVVEQPSLLQENHLIHHAMTEPATENLVNTFHNIINLSTSEGKKLHQKVIAGFPEANK